MTDVDSNVYFNLWLQLGVNIFIKIDLGASKAASWRRLGASRGVLGAKTLLGRVSVPIWAALGRLLGGSGPIAVL